MVSDSRPSASASATAADSARARLRGTRGSDFVLVGLRMSASRLLGTRQHLSLTTLQRTITVSTHTLQRKSAPPSWAATGGRHGGINHTSERPSGGTADVER